MCLFTGDDEENNKNTRVLITVIVCVVLVILIISAICVIKAAFIESEKEKFINSSVPLNNMSTDSQLTSALKLLKEISLSLDGKDRTNLERAMNVNPQYSHIYIHTHTKHFYF